VTFPIILVMYVAFFLYLLMVGAGLERAFAVMVKAAISTIAASLLVALLPLVYLPSFGKYIFLGAAMVFSFVSLTQAAMGRARRFIVPETSTLEIVCVNVFMVALGGAPESLEYFGTLVEFVYQVILNPLSPLFPDELSWMATPLALWPSALALFLVARGTSGRAGRFALMFWLQVLGILWLLPPAFETLVDGGREMTFGVFAMLMAAVAMVRVWLTAVTLREGTLGRLDTRDFEDDTDVEEAAARSRTLADRVTVMRLPAWCYVTGGLAAYLLANAMLHFLDDVQAISTGYFVILAFTSLVARWYTRVSPELNHAAAQSVTAFVALLALVPALRQLPLLPRFVPAEHPREARQAPALVPVKPKPPPRAEQPREVEVVLIPGLHDGEHHACVVEHLAGLRVTCAGESWPLASVAHPEHVVVPMEVGPPFATYEFHALDVEARCQEMPVRAPRSQSEDVLLLVYLSTASLRDQVGWVAGPDAACRDLGAVIHPDSSPDEPTILFRPGERGAGRDPGTLETVVTLRRHPQQEAAIGDPP
jgi:hypothetical protein